MIGLDREQTRFHRRGLARRFQNATAGGNHLYNWIPIMDRKALCVIWFKAVPQQAPTMATGFREKPSSFSGAASLAALPASMAAGAFLGRQLVKWIYRQNAKRHEVSNIAGQNYQLMTTSGRADNNVSEARSKAFSTSQVQ
jgi:hypothetical protein